MRSGRKGYIIIVAVFIMLITSMMSIAVAQSLSSGLKSIMSKYYKLQALYNAQRGVYAVINEYMRDPETPYISLTNCVSPDNSYQIGTAQSDLFLVSTARVRVMGTRNWSADPPFTLRGVGLGNVSDGGGAKNFSVVIESLPAADIGSAVSTSSLGAKEFKPNAITITYNTRPKLVVATFTFGDDSPSHPSFMKVVLYKYQGWGPNREITSTMYNYFTITSTGKVTAGADVYTRTIVAAYDVSFSRIRFWRESTDHVY